MELRRCRTTALLSRLALWHHCSHLFIQVLNTFSLLGINCLEHSVAGQEKERTSREASYQELMRPWQSFSPVLTAGRMYVWTTAQWGRVRKYFTLGQGHTPISAIFTSPSDTMRERERVNNVGDRGAGHREGLWGGWRMAEDGFSNTMSEFWCWY